MFLIRILLFPFAVLYDAITRLRNRLYELGLKPSASFDIALISVGNLTVGGTGKTPLVEHLLRLLLANHYSSATLSRGYGRETKGMRIANINDSAATLGDEPFQLFQKFKDASIISVCEERAMAIPFLVDQYPNLQAIVLDDAFQHRAVKPGLSILLTDYSTPFYNDFLLPAGRLREARRGAIRATIIVVTKCPPHIEEEEMMQIEHNIRQYAEKPVFFSKIRYGTPQCFKQEARMDRRVVLLSGLANSNVLEHYVESNFELLKHVEYKDHHAYTRAEVEKVALYAREHNAEILTTEKDWTKLQFLVPEKDRTLFYFLPIEVEFVKGGSDFDALVLDYVREAHASSID